MSDGARTEVAGGRRGQVSGADHALGSRGHECRARLAVAVIRLPLLFAADSPLRPAQDCPPGGPGIVIPNPTHVCLLLARVGRPFVATQLSQPVLSRPQPEGVLSRPNVRGIAMPRL